MFAQSLKMRAKAAHGAKRPTVFYLFARTSLVESLQNCYHSMQ